MILHRTANLPTATRGELLSDDGAFFCHTLEEPWRDANHDGLGDRSVSRIPAGTFTCFRRYSQSRKREVFEVRDVPGRSAILIHSGNTVADTEGCILVGFRTGDLDGEPAVLESKKAMDAFMASLAGVQTFTLVVEDAP